VFILRRLDTGIIGLATMFHAAFPTANTAIMKTTTKTTTAMTPATTTTDFHTTRQRQRDNDNDDAMTQPRR
jgi:hypothetical protein